MTFNSREFRNALGKFATGVCVITASPKGFTPFGITVSSFSSLSLDPPLILWSIQKDSECLPAFEKTEYFTVNVLAPEHESLSTRFSKRGDHDLTEGSYFLGASGAPVLDGNFTSFECRLEATHEGVASAVPRPVVGTIRNDAISS